MMLPTPIHPVSVPAYSHISSVHYRWSLPLAHVCLYVCYYAVTCVIFAIAIAFIATRHTMLLFVPAPRVSYNSNTLSLHVPLFPPFPRCLNVHAHTRTQVDLNREGIWARLLDLASKSCGTMTFPLSAPQATVGNDISALAKAAGCNLFTHTPEIRNWLIDVAPGKPLVIGGYAYLDSAAHVQVRHECIPVSVSLTCALCLGCQLLLHCLCMGVWAR